MAVLAIGDLEGEALRTVAKIAFACEGDFCACDFVSDDENIFFDKNQKPNFWIAIQRLDIQKIDDLLCLSRSSGLRPQFPLTGFTIEKYG